MFEVFPRDFSQNFKICFQPFMLNINIRQHLRATSAVNELTTRTLGFLCIILIALYMWGFCIVFIRLFYQLSQFLLAHTRNCFQFFQIYRIFYTFRQIFL